MTGVARGLNRIHDLGIVHGNLGMVRLPPYHAFVLHSPHLLDKYTYRQWWHPPHRWSWKRDRSSKLHNLDSGGYGLHRSTFPHLRARVDLAGGVIESNRPHQG